MDVVGALARVLLVFGLLAVVLVVLKRTGGVGAKRAGAMQVVASARLAKGAALTVVRLDGREYVLGVTEHTVTLLQDQTGERVEPVTLPVAATAPATGATPASPATPPAPPTLPAFLKNLWASRGGRVLDATELSKAAVTAALAHATGRPTPVVPLAVPPRTAPAVPVADGTATPDLPRPRTARTDALLDEEHPWSRACAPAFRAAERASAVR
ncbi:MAG: flagellar biosynthetic protein FliO [Mycobacteriales bacterium]|nr:flagellar biosynthetic protein FliO [Mycobacteriales bacterium]